MSYGLYDGDLNSYDKIPFFNLELMKMATYYRHHHEIASLSPSFSPQMYSYFIVRQDYYNSKGYPHTDIPLDRLSFHGRFFDGETYKPLPLDMEICQPDVNLYDKIESEIVHNKTLKNGFSVMRRAEHIRLSLDGKTIWPSFERQLRHDPTHFGLILHDYDLGAINDSLDIVHDILNDLYRSSAFKRIGTKFPVQTNTIDSLLSWLEFNPLQQFNVQYNGIFIPDDYEKLILVNPHTTVIEQSTINPTRNISYENFISTGIIQLFESILDLRRLHINFSLNYDKDFFTDNKWKEVMRLIQMFNQHIHYYLSDKDYMKRVAPYETFYSYVKSLTKKHILFGSRYPKEKAAELFQFVRENNYELFVRFYEYTGESK